MFDFTVLTVFLFLISLFVALSIAVWAILIRWLIIHVIPVIAELYGRIRYPDKFSD